MSTKKQRIIRLYQTGVFNWEETVEMFQYHCSLSMTDILCLIGTKAQYLLTQGKKA